MTKDLQSNSSKSRLPGMMTCEGTELLGAWRAGRSITQAHAAAIIGVNQPIYSKYERGDRRPGIRWAMQIERVCGIPIGAWV